MKAHYGMVLLLCCSAAAESRFVDIAQSAGVDFVHRSGAAGEKSLAAYEKIKQVEGGYPALPRAAAQRSTTP